MPKVGNGARPSLGVGPNVYMARCERRYLRRANSNHLSRLIRKLWHRNRLRHNTARL